MDVYIFQASFLCINCGEKACREFQDGHSDMVPDCICGAPFMDHKVDYDNGAILGKLVAETGDHYCYGYTADEHTYDSDDYPKGPFPDGGGEADCPNYCDDCGMFLENPLTDEGMEYVTNSVKEMFTNKHYNGNTKVVSEWKEFYDIPNPNDTNDE